LTTRTWSFSAWRLAAFKQPVVAGKESCRSRRFGGGDVYGVRGLDPKLLHLACPRKDFLCQCNKQVRFLQKR
jgi:hypothetical protein